jgi:hypothetical protein
MSVAIAMCVSILDLKESFQRPFREADLKAFTLDLDFGTCTTEEELEAAIHRAGVLLDRLTLIEVDMAARFNLLKRYLRIKRIDGYREFNEKVTTLRKVAKTIIDLLQTDQIAGRMQAGLSPRSIAPARFPSALTFRLMELPSELPDLLTLSEVSAILGLDEATTEALAAAGDIPSDHIAGERSFVRVALEHWLSHAKGERVKRL